MGAERFNISQNNPNDAIGGGGCFCSETKHEDCRGPFAIGYATEMASNLSPHNAISVRCAQRIVERALEGDILAAGEAPVALPESSVADPEVPRHENPTVGEQDVLDAYRHTLEDAPEL